MNKKLIGLLIANLVAYQMPLLAHIIPEYTEEVVLTNKYNKVPKILEQNTIEHTKLNSINNIGQAIRVNYAPESITESEIKASGKCGDKLTWALYNDGTLKISGEGEMYDNCTSWKGYNFTKVIIEDSVTSIGTNAFQSCSALESIEISSSVESIGINAFQGCESLIDITMPFNITKIASYAFDGCTALESIKIPSNVTEIGMYAFNGCTALTDIEIPSSVMTIGSNAFEGCIALTSIKIPSSVTKIKEYAFQSCTALTSIEIPSGVESIGKSAFQNCIALESIEMPVSVKLIGASVFSGCTALRFINYQGTQSEWNDIDMKATIPNQTIFYFSTNFRIEGITNSILLTTVQDALIDTYKVLKKDGTDLRFTQTPDVKSFEPSNEKLAEIADSIEGIETISFKDNVFTITEAIIPEEPEEPTEAAKPEEPEEATEPTKSEEVEEVTEPTKPEEVEESTEPTKPEEVEEATESTILEEVEEPTEITKPEESEELTESTKPEEVEESTEPTKPEESEELTESTISEEVEESTEITILEKVEPTEITKPEEIEEPTEITKPEEIEEPIEITKPEEVEDLTEPTMPETLEVLEKLETLEIPNKQIEDTFFITNTDNNQDQITEVIITGIKENIDLTNITELEIPKEINGIPVVAINDNAFANSPNLTKVTIAEGIKTIGDGIFENCPKLVEIILPQGVETIGENAFSNSGLIEFIIPNSVTYVGKGAFEGCENLIHIILPESLEELEEDLCNGCSALEKVYIVTSDNNRSTEAHTITMARKTFTMPRALKNRDNLILPSHTKLSRIKANAFKDCMNLKNIYYGGTKEEWNTIEIDSSNDILFKVSIQYLGESNHTNTDTTQLDDQSINDIDKIPANINKLPTDAKELPTDMELIDTNQLPNDINESSTDINEPLTDINKLLTNRNQLSIDTNQSVAMNTPSSILSHNKALKLSNKYHRSKIKTYLSIGGSLKLNTNYTTKGTNVKINVVPDSSYKLDELTVTDANGKTIQITKKSGTYTFLMPDKDVTVNATFVVK